MDKRPLVTIAALCYNHSAYVIQTLESILAQSYDNLQVIIIDDCSKDDSVAVIRRWLADKQLYWEFIEHKANRGVSASLNEAIDMAQGIFFKGISCDDELLPSCIDTLVNAFKNSAPGCGLVFADMITMDENSNSYGSTPFADRGWKTQQDVPSGKLFDALAAVNFIPAPATLMLTDAMKKDRFDTALYFEDWDMWLRLAKQYNITGVFTPVVRYRIHSSSMFQQQNPAFIDAALQTAKKHMGYSKVADKHLRQFIVEWSMKNYMADGKHRAKWMWYRFIYQPSLGSFHKLCKLIIGINSKN